MICLMMWLSGTSAAYFSYVLFFLFFFIVPLTAAVVIYCASCAAVSPSKSWLIFPGEQPWCSTLLTSSYTLSSLQLEWAILSRGSSTAKDGEGTESGRLIISQLHSATSFFLNTDAIPNTMSVAARFFFRIARAIGSEGGKAISQLGRALWWSC